VIIHLSELFLGAHDVGIVSLPPTDISSPMLHLTNGFLCIPLFPLLHISWSSVGSKINPDTIVLPWDEIFFAWMKETTEVSTIIDSQWEDKEWIHAIPRVKALNPLREISDWHDALLDDVSIDRGLANHRSLKQFQEGDFRSTHPSPEDAIKWMVRKRNHIFQLPEDAPVGS
jgi:hypothetical protein